MGRRIGLREPRRAGPQSPGRRDARRASGPIRSSIRAAPTPSSTRAILFRLRMRLHGIDFEAEIAVITGDVPMGASRARQALRSGWSFSSTTYRCAISSPTELGKGFGFFQSKPASIASRRSRSRPTSWATHGTAANCTCRCSPASTASLFGRPNAGVDMTFDFPTLIAHAAQTRSLGAGTIIGSGTVSNKERMAGRGIPVTEGGVGYSCIAEQRTIGDDPERRGKNAVSALRRHDPHRDEGQGRDIPSSAQSSRRSSATKSRHSLSPPTSFRPTRRVLP